MESTTYGVETRKLVWDTPHIVFHVGDFVRKLRTAEGRDWTVEQLAEKAGLNKATISKLERGELDPRKSTLEKVAAALGVTVAYLVTGSDSPSASNKGDAVLARLKEARRDLGHIQTFLQGALETVESTLKGLDDLADDRPDAPRKRA